MKESKEYLRKEFEKFWGRSNSLNSKIRPDALARTSAAPGILRDYQLQDTEIAWRGFQAGYQFLLNNQKRS